ncbi:MAG: hypothetical protein AAFV98_12360, partial [Chloroflexota bacterium]
VCFALLQAFGHSAQILSHNSYILPVMAIDLFNQADLNERSNAMALSVIISSIVMVLVAFYMWLRDWANKRQ